MKRDVGNHSLAMCSKQRKDFDRWIARGLCHKGKPIFFRSLQILIYFFVVIGCQIVSVSFFVMELTSKFSERNRSSRRYNKIAFQTFLFKSAVFTTEVSMELMQKFTCVPGPLQWDHTWIHGPRGPSQVTVLSKQSQQDRGGQRGGSLRWWYFLTRLVYSN